MIDYHATLCYLAIGISCVALAISFVTLALLLGSA